MRDPRYLEEYDEPYTVTQYGVATESGEAMYTEDLDLAVKTVKGRDDLTLVQREVTFGVWHVMPRPKPGRAAAMKPPASN